ncbi:hypothetical protein [Paenibacillus sp.]|uniref:hypothetical protein n=1 Tax=Paenibacillus sp. TaxID=58172 RepID=UPI002D2FB35C|nr:hypothetical protein [Paenibacillus sp.]HZG55449.1 hypothetical protein [Paenibacillus sp.]
MTKENKKEGEPLPPRSRVHPSNKMKMVRLFYNVLIAAFFLLTAGLVFWGIQFLE